jgi:hypothetical protein
LCLALVVVVAVLHGRDAAAEPFQFAPEPQESLVVDSGEVHRLTVVDERMHARKYRCRGGLLRNRAHAYDVRADVRHHV